MDSGQLIGPQGAPGAGAGANNPQALQAALLRMSPEQLSAMFEPYQDKLDVLNQGAKQQAHTSVGGALLGGLGNIFSSIDRRGLLERMQADATARMGALGYGRGATGSAGSAGPSPVLAGGFRSEYAPQGAPSQAPGPQAPQGQQAVDPSIVPALLRRPQPDADSTPDIPDYVSGR